MVLLRAIMERLIATPGLFRIVLALLVVLSHSTRVQTGRLGVILFFVLSGYWVLDLWVRSERGRSVFHFYLNRFMRIWPLFFVVALLSLALSRGPFHGSQMLLLGIASDPRPRPIGVEWSLDIEAQFYLILPLLALLLGRLRGAGAVVAVAAATALGWALLRFEGFRSVLCYLPAFAAGMAIYRSSYRVSERQAHLSLALFLAFTLLLAALPWTRPMVIKGGEMAMDEDLFAMLWALPLLPYVACSLRRPSSKFDRGMGDFSFPLYLLHYPVIRLLSSGEFPPLLASKPVMVAAAVLASLALYVFVDRPFERLRRSALQASGREALARLAIWRRSSDLS